MKIIETKQDEYATHSRWDLLPVNIPTLREKQEWYEVYNSCAKQLGFWRDKWSSIPKTKEAHMLLGEAMEKAGKQVELRKSWIHYR
jgi:hypothetical protein